MSGHIAKVHETMGLRSATERAVFYVALGGVCFVAYRAWRALSAAGEAAAWAAGKAGEKTANAFEWFFPFDIGETLFYNVQFPDGASHAVPSRSVSALGRFTYSGVNYRLVVDRRIKSGINKFAVKV